MALATLVLAPLLSAGVVAYQLSREHSFVEAQRRLAREQARLDEKIRIQTRVATLVPSTALTRTQLAVNDLFLTAAMLGEEESPGKLKDAFGKFADTHHQLDGQFQSQATELAGYLAAARHYYAEDVAKAINAFGEHFNST